MLGKDYKFGFVTDVESVVFPKGLSEEVVRAISSKRNEPSFLLDFRLKAYDLWSKMTPPSWPNFKGDYSVDFQDMSYHSELKDKPKLNSLDEVDPKILETYNRLGIPLEEQKQLANVAVDLVFDSTSIGMIAKKKLEDSGVIFCSMNEAIARHPKLIEEYIGSVVPIGDNFFSALNSAVFSDGSFVYLPKGVISPIELSTYFRINEKNNGQFERTLIVAEDDSYVSYLEGCTAPSFDSKQLHAAVVEIVAKKDATVKYSTVQNWYSGDEDGKGGVFNFVTKRGRCLGSRSKITWTQVEAGSAFTWKYPSCILEGAYSVGEFYSVALTNGRMEADTGTKMIHKGIGSSSTIISKGISADLSHNSYRGRVFISSSAEDARNYTQCDSMLMGNTCSANTFPDIEVHNTTSCVEHEASTSKISLEEIFYLQSRGISFENAINLIVNGFCKDVVDRLPLEFVVEARKLLSIKLEHSVG